MSGIQTVVFFLCGALLNKTILLGGRFQFIEGRLELTGSESELVKLAHFLEVNWSVFPEGHPRLQEINDEFNALHAGSGGNIPDLQTDDQPNGEGLGAQETNDGSLTAGGASGKTEELPNGNGQTTELNGKLKAAVLAVDPDNDDCWTGDGKPKMDAVGALYGSTGITRADVEEVAPGYNRNAAREAKANAAG